MDSDQLARAVFERTRTPAFRDYLRDLLVDICAVDTTPNSDVTVMRRAEATVFDTLEGQLESTALPGGRCERRPIDPAIAGHANY